MSPRGAAEENKHQTCKPHELIVALNGDHLCPNPSVGMSTDAAGKNARASAWGVNRFLLMAALRVGVCQQARSHDIGSSPTTWNREISRVFYERCVSCHHEGGTAFSLMMYQDAQPRAVEIKEAVLSRRMPPWVQ